MTKKTRLTRSYPIQKVRIRLDLNKIISLTKVAMSIKSKSALVLVILTAIFLAGCTSKNVTVTTDNKPSNFTLAAVHGVPSNTSIEMNSWPKKIILKSDEQNITRKIDIEEREQCYTVHPFGFETYSGDFTTKSGQKLNRLSYPEQDDSLFVIDEYGFTLDNGHCLTFSYGAVITDAISSTKEYDKAVYSNELDIAAEIMSTLTVPNK